MTHLLECIGVQKRFGNFVATQGIDLAVPSGEFVGMIGANGAGKTTLLNVVSGYLRPSAGKVIFQGLDVTGIQPRILARRGIARSFQVPQLFAHATACENMMLALALLVEPKASLMRPFADARLSADARRVLASYGIDGYADTVVSKLPQGVRKLIDIAMATCGHPKLVLLDEPTSGVSNEEKHDLMMRLAQRFSAASTTVMFIEHDLEIVRTYASRVVALYDGKIICDGAPEIVFGDESVMRLIAGHFKPAARQ
jgi:branched-chain amino acid transport system ATP-binding protein